MKKTLMAVAVLGALASGAVCALAQGMENQGPPPVLAISREEIKPGRMAVHEKLNASYAALMNRTPSKSYWLGLVPVSGDDNAAMFLSAFGSFAEVEAARKDDEATATSAAVKTDLEQLDRQGGDVHQVQRTAYARLRSDISFHPGGMAEVAQSRYFVVTTVRVKPGRGPDYVEYVKAVNAARDKAGVKAGFAVYQIVTGAPNGTFLYFRPLRTLKTWDDEEQAREAMGKAIREAEGGEEAARKMRMTLADVVATSETSVYAMNPKMSRPAPAFAQADMAFWNPAKPAGETKALAAKKATAPKASEKKQ